MSPEPRVLTEDEINLVKELAGIVSTELELKLALKQLRENHSQVLQLEKMSSIGRLAAGVAHEINTPIQFLGDNLHFLHDGFDQRQKLMNGYAKLMTAAREKGVLTEECECISELEAEVEADYLAKEIPAAVEQSLEGITRVSNLVNAMKNFSHPSQNEKVAADINAAIDATAAISRNEWKYNSELILELDRELPPVDCMIGELNQVILNMIINATHSIESAIELKLITRGAIHIQTSRQDEQLVIVITDNGVGIPAAIINKIYDPFFTTKRVGKGTGQGLAISYDVIVNKHQGSVVVTSEINQGACFRITIPLKGKSELSTP